MNGVLYLSTALAILGAADTIYYHEWRARLPGMGRAGGSELQLHAYRDFVYAILFAALPWSSWQGAWSLVLAGLLLTEVILTLWDFVVEDWIRKPLGGVYHGERIMHAIMGIVYGAMLANIVPVIHQWCSMPSALVFAPVPVSRFVRWFLTLAAAGVLLSGIRDLCAAYEVPGSAWPWPGGEKRQS